MFLWAAFVGQLAWVGLGYLLSWPYGALTGFTTPMQRVVASLLLPVSLFLFAKGAETVERAVTHEELIMGRGMMISMFCGLLLPIVLHMGGAVPIPQWLTLYHTYRFTLAVVLAGALMVATRIVQADDV